MLHTLTVTPTKSTTSECDAANGLNIALNHLSRCHSGELYYVFGTLASLPYRDANDLPFMKMSLDTWASFVRTYNPNPSPLFLAARGFTDVLARFAAQPQWEQVTSANLKKKPLRQLQWGSFMTGFKEEPQCSFLNFGMDYYDTHPAV